MPDVLRWAGIAMLLLAVALPVALFSASFHLTAEPGARIYLWMLGIGAGAFCVCLATIPFGLARLLDHLPPASISARRAS